MKKWNLLIDVEKCFNCNNCALAVHDEYHGNSFPGYAEEMPRLGHRWIDIVQSERGAFPMVDVAYLPVTCNHCDDAPCLKAAKNGAVVKRADGIVIIVPEKAKGQRQIVEACPYGAVWWNEEKQLPQAWPFDAHLLDRGWTKTRGAQSCPTEAMRSICVEDTEMTAIAKAEGYETLNPEYGTKPRVYYKNLHRVRSLLIGGSVAGEIGGVTECVAGARIILKKNETQVAATVSDTFGDFRFDGLPQDGGAYHIDIKAERFAAKSISCTVKESAYLGVISLGAAS
ncbi:MAG: oxidoreductase [Xanthobacteraceae bacterium]|nr:MAG: oxidoreductase [Xanthobacteraceae bacterium]